jgi:hypothetical protein
MKASQVARRPRRSAKKGEAVQTRLVRSREDCFEALSLKSLCPWSRLQRVAARPTRVSERERRESAEGCFDRADRWGSVS